jgi:hypothetical protein
MWFTENAWPPMIIAALVALVFLGMWSSDRRSVYFFLAIGCLASIGVFYFIERSILTEGEKLQLDVAQMCDQFRRKDEATLSHFSHTADDLKALCAMAMKEVEIDNDMNLTDFRTNLTNENSRATVHFRANATIGAMGFKGHHPFRCLLTYQKEGGQWKIVEVERLDPIKGDRMEVMARR